MHTDLQRIDVGDVSLEVHIAGASEAVFIGHDWGAPIAWSTALLHPDCVRAVVGMSVPHVGRGGPMPPTELLRALHGDRFLYIGGIHRYRNMDADWHDLEAFDSQRIQQPALFLAGEHDSVLRYAPGMNLMDMMDPFFDDLRGRHLVPGAGHWVQQEQPQAVNELLLAFLKGLD